MIFRVFSQFFFSCGHATLKEALSVGLLVRWFFRRYVGPFVGPGKTSVQIYFVYVCVLGVGWGVDGGWMPISIRL